MAVGRLMRAGIFLLMLALFASACSSSNETAADSTAADDAATTIPADDESTETSDAEPADEPEEQTDEAEAEESEAAEPASAPALEPAACEFDPPPGVNVNCSWITVPQNWDDASDPDTIRLHVAEFSTSLTPADATPVIYLEGGPGGSTFEAVALSFNDRFGPILDQHPFFMFSQRGSNLSEVDLECEEVVDLTFQQFEAVPDQASEVDEVIEALTTCADRLVEEGADLSSYHSVASANDIDAIRQAVGFDEWNVLGISYGTRLGQELLRTHPDGVRAIVLDSVQPTDPRLGSIAAVPTTFAGSFEQLIAGCEANADCAAANPDLDARLRALAAQADAEPFEVEATDQLTGDSFDVIIDDTRLLGTIFQALYTPEAFAAIPEMIGQLEQGDTSTLATLAGLQLTNARFISNGMFTAVMCHDFVAELTPESAWDEGRVGDELFDVRFGAAQESQTRQMCSAFDTGSAPASIVEPVTSDVPTLLMSGAYDPITPPSFAEAIEPGLSNSQSVVLPHAGHATVGDECGLTIALDFFADPSSTADQSCLSGSDEPVWVPASLEGTEFEPFEEQLLGMSGVAPAGWVSQGPGVTVRDDTNIAHQTALIQQGGPIPTDQFLSLLSAQFGSEATSRGDVEVAGRTWAINDFDGPLGGVSAYTHEVDGFTLFVAVLGQPNDIAEVVEFIIPTVLEEVDTL